MMKKANLLVFAVVVLCTCVLSLDFASRPVRAASSPAAASSSAASAPRIVVAEPVFDFGKAYEGRPVVHVFKVANMGGAPLAIKRVHTSCGCTAAAPSKQMLNPGETAEIAVTFDTRFQKGERVRTIDIFTDDPKTPMTTVTLKGQVQLEAEARPSEIDFGKLRQGSEARRGVIVSDLIGGRNFTVGPISNSNPNIKVTQAARKDGKPGAELQIVMLKSMPAGPFNDIVRIETNRRPVQVHLFGRVSGDLEVEPAQISFGIVPHGKGAVRILTLTNNGSAPVRITSVTSSSSSVAVRVDPVSPGKNYKLMAELRKGTPDGQLRGQLVIRTDDPKEPSVSVTYYGIVGKFSSRLN